MAELTAEQFAQRTFDLGLLNERQLDTVWAEFGTRDIPVRDFQNLLLRRELLTNFQVEKLLRGDRSGFFYGDYKVQYLIGTGTFARVFRSVHRENGRVMAVKVLRKRMAENAENVEQFLQEGQMGAQLRHPAIVPIYEVHSSPSGHYLLMEFVEGHNLRDFVRVRQKFEAAEAVRLMIDVCSGLTYAFERGLTHRDLKLSNILVSSSGRARIVDFGLAALNGKVTDENIGQVTNPRTIDYAALERATGVRKDDPRSDVYFTGCILYHMLTGKAPLRETRDRLQRLSLARFEEIVPITTLEPTLPVPVVIVVNKAMELNVKKRYQTPAEMLADLKLAERRLQEASESGESLAANAGSAEAIAESLGEDEPALEGTGKTVLIVESNTGMQDVLREQLRRHGYRVLVFSDPKRALARFEHDDGHVADCVMFSGQSLGAAALEAFNEFAKHEQTKDLAAILLLNERQKSWQATAQTSPCREVVMMPVRMRQLRSSLKKLIAARPAK